MSSTELCLANPVNISVTSSQTTGKTAHERMKDDGWEEICQIWATYKIDQHPYTKNKCFYIYYKNGHYVAIPATERDRCTDPTKSPIVKGNFKIQDQTFNAFITDGFESYYINF